MSRKIYIGNLNWEVTDSDLRNLFSPVGAIESCEVVREQDGRSRGFGFIEFTMTEDAENAVHTMHGEKLKGRELIVQIAKDKPKHRVRRDRRGPSAAGSSTMGLAKRKLCRRKPSGEIAPVSQSSEMR